jgi:hypothetical protein
VGDPDLDAILREHGGLEGLAAQIGQTDAREYCREDDVGRSAPGKPVGLGFLRKVLASIAARFGRTSNPVGAGRIERPIASARPMHRMRSSRRNPSTSQLGGADIGFMPFPVERRGDLHIGGNDEAAN